MSREAFLLLMDELLELPPGTLKGDERLDSLGDDTLKAVALWKLEGYSNEEIAAKLRCVTRSVERKLNVIRRGRRF